ncbi:hypothetical protein SMC26_38645 [Actinomadura fulvescens]|uniref:Carboxypeptidase regulatory-like domain-containing protein n=1 Tax=Actinomadura fulvescens TaxID=46160 RepID=A0ABN3QCA1_9ACTN
MPLISMEVTLRRLLAVLIALAMVTVAAPSASATAEDLTVQAVIRDYSGTAWSDHLLVHVTSGHDVTQVKIWMTPAGATEPGTSVEGSPQSSGTPRDRWWKSRERMELPWGRADVTVEAHDASGAKVTKKFPGALLTLARARFKDFTVTPGHLGVDHGPLTFRGRLVYEDREGVEHPLAGARVVWMASLGVEATTRADGGFSGTTSLKRGGDVEIKYLGYDYEPGYFSSAYAVQKVTVDNAETRLRAAYDRKPTVVGQPVTISGKLERKSSTGRWLPLRGGNVQVRDASGKWLAAQYTYPDGTFRSIKTRARTKLTVVFDPLGDSFVPAQVNLPAAGTLALRYRPRLTNITVTPRPVGQGARLNIRGRVLRQGVDGSSEIAHRTRVEAQFSTDKRTWSTRSAGIAGAKGDFKLTPVAHKDGYWRVIVNDRRYLPGPSTPTFVDVRHRTAFISFNASPEPIRKGATLTVSGMLNRHVGSWKPGSGAPIDVYFKPTGSSKWTRMAVVRTDRRGRFLKTFKAFRDGTWLATYKGGPAYLAAWSPTDYIDVR